MLSCVNSTAALKLFKCRVSGIGDQQANLPECNINGVSSHHMHRLLRFHVESLNNNYHKYFTSMASTAEIYSEAILFMLDSISPTQRILLKNDLRLKLDRAYELQPSTLQGLKLLEGLMKASEFSRTIQ